MRTHADVTYSGLRRTLLHATGVAKHLSIIIINSCRMGDQSLDILYKHRNFARM